MSLLRITGFQDSVHLPENQIAKKNNVTLAVALSSYFLIPYN
jgi:hypothetical protein